MRFLRNDAVCLFPWHQLCCQAPGLTYDRNKKLHTLVTQKRDSRKVARTMPRVKSSRCRCSSWNSSTSPVITDSMPPICETQRMVVDITLQGLTSHLVYAQGGVKKGVHSRLGVR